MLKATTIKDPVSKSSASDISTTNTLREAIKETSVLVPGSRKVKNWVFQLKPFYISYIVKKIDSFHGDKK